jgi:hypothetical protein
MDSYFLGIDIRLTMEFRKVSVNKKDDHFNIPSSGILINTINIFLKAKNKARFILDITKRFFHVDFFLQISMQECRFDIHLMDLPFL